MNHKIAASKPLGLIINLLLFTVITAIFVPFYPKMPRPGLDPSWAFAMNQAVEQGFRIGKDIIFTFGPYASIYTKSYHPATDVLMISGSVYLGISYWFAAYLLTNKSNIHLIYLIFLLFISSTFLSFSRDALFLSYPLLAGIICSNISFKSLKKNRLVTTLIILTAFLPFGLIILVKGSFFILSLLVAILTTIFFLLNKNWSNAITTVIGTVSSVPIFWLLSGQSILDLPQYFVAMMPIALGFTESMSLNGTSYDIVAYIFIYLLTSFFIIQEKSISGLYKINLTLLYSAFIFIAFKAGFVRHDSHALIAGNSIVIAGIFMLIIAQTHKFDKIYILFISLILSVFLICSMTLFYGSRTISANNALSLNGVNATELSKLSNYEKTKLVYEKLGATFLFNYIAEPFIKPNHIFKSIYGLQQRHLVENWLPGLYSKSIEDINKGSGFPVLSGTTDIYSYNQSFLIASGSRWNPRPIFQSYSAYTPLLLNKNKQHLLGVRSPDNVVFKVEPLDDRMPSLDDGVSWPVIYQKYKPVTLKNDFLFLKRDERFITLNEKVLASKSVHQLSEIVTIPKSEYPVMAEISIRQSIIGKLLNILYKPSQLSITLYLVNGDIKKYRLIASMAKTGLLITPLIENTTEFTRLYAGINFIKNKTVRSFSISPLYGDFDWMSNYELTFKEFNIPPISQSSVIELLN
jgi:hypothetical protein